MTTTQCLILAAVSRALGLACAPSAETAVTCNSLEDFYDATVAEIHAHLSRSYPDPDEMPTFDPNLHAWRWLGSRFIHETATLRLRVEADLEGRVHLVFNARGALRPDGYTYESVRVAAVTLMQSGEDASRLAVAVDVPDQAELARRPDRIALLVRFDEELGGELFTALGLATVNDPEAQAVWSAVCAIQNGWSAFVCERCGEKIAADQRYVGWWTYYENRQHLTCYELAAIDAARAPLLRY